MLLFGCFQVDLCLLVHFFLVFLQLRLINNLRFFLRHAVNSRMLLFQIDYIGHKNAIKITQSPSDVLDTSLEEVEVALRQFAVRVVRKQGRFVPHKGTEGRIGPQIRNLVGCIDTPESLEPVVELGLSLPHKRSQFCIMLPDNRSHKFLKIFIEPTRQRIIAA